MVVCPTPEGALQRSQLPALKEKASDRRAGSPLAPMLGMQRIQVRSINKKKAWAGWMLLMGKEKDICKKLDDKGRRTVTRV